MKFSKSSKTNQLAKVAAAASLSFGLAIAAPLAAGAAPLESGVTKVSGSPNYELGINCNDLQWNGDGTTLTAVPGGSLTLTTTRCDDVDQNSALKYKMIITDYGDSNSATPGYTAGGVHHSGEVTVPIAIPASFTLDPDTYVTFKVVGASDTYMVSYKAVPDLVANPGGTLGRSTEVVIPAANPLHTTFPGNLIPSDTTGACGLNNMNLQTSGEHVYQTYEFDISKSGAYTFQFVATSPDDRRFFPWGESTLNDPFLAVYRTFDPAHPTTGVVGCNDDAGSDFNGVTANGHLVDQHYSRFRSSLTAGHYTLVLTTWNESTVAGWLNEGKAAGGTFELWGPRGAFVSESGLANTGSDATVLYIASALFISAGVFVLVLSKRRVAKK